MVQTVQGETNWFQVGKELRQSCIPFLYLFNLYAQSILRETGRCDFKTGGRNISSLYYADDIILVAKTAKEFAKSRNKNQEHSEKWDKD